MFFGRSQLINRSPILRYGVATALVAVAMLLTSGLWLVVDRPASTPIFLVVIALVTWTGGLRLGVYTTALSAVVFDYSYIRPYRDANTDVDTVMRMIVLFAQGCFMAWIADRWRLATDELSDSREELRQLSQHQQTLREAEQKSIAREIHDELGQALTGLKLDLHLVRKEVNAVRNGTDGENVIQEIDSMSKRIDETIATVRRISSEIRPSILDDFGLVAAIEWQTRQFERKTGVECAFRSNSENIHLDPDAASAVFRIFQEALTNIARHADASMVKVLIDVLPDRMAMRVEDNGRGIDLAELARTGSLGIIGMKERARLIGASLSIEPLDGHGTLVELIIPKKKTAAAAAA